MKNKARARTEVKEPGLDRQTLLAIYRNMILSRRIDDKQIQLKRQNKIFFQIAGAGHEAVLTAAGMVLKPGHDWFYAYYRDMALMLQLGMTPLEILLEALGAADDPNSGGRQMPSHWGHPRLNIVSKSSCTGTQYLQSVGCSQAGRYISIVKECQERGLRFQEDEVTYVSGGEGSTSEGEFWEALNTACNLKLPMLFLIEDNKYAISVPVEVQTAGGTIKGLVQNWPNLRYEEIDGCDPLESHRVLSDVVGDLRRRREGPALVQAHCIRPYSHSLSDDERLYKPERERQEEAKRDPIVRHEKLLLEEKIDVGVVSESPWPSDIPVVGSCAVKQQNAVYRRAKVALSINNYNQIDSYFSDRQLIAMASGTPVVCRHVPGLDVEFRDGNECAMFGGECTDDNRDELDDMAYQVGKLLRNPVQAKLVGLLGRMRVMQEHSWQRRILDLLPAVESWRYQL